MGGHIDKPDIIQTGSGSGEQSATVPDVTTIIASSDSAIKPIEKKKSSAFTMKGSPMQRNFGISPMRDFISRSGTTKASTKDTIIAKPPK